MLPLSNVSKGDDYFEDYTHPTVLDHAHTSWETFTRDLNIACEAICAPPSVDYDGVHALLMNWMDDDLGTVAELIELDALLKEEFHYSTEIWKIPTKQTEFEVGQKLAQLTSQMAGKNRLLIVYYGGHGCFDKNGRSIWQAYVYRLRSAAARLSSFYCA